MSESQKKYIKDYKRNKLFIISIQLLIIVLFFSIWEYCSNKNIINPFIFSSPSKIFKTIYELKFDLIKHISITLYEIFISFSIGIALSIIFSIILYSFPIIYKVFDPFITVINSLPKVCLGPMIIIVAGANIKSVIIMAILINVIVSTVVITNGFYNTDYLRIKLLRSFNATRFQILRYLVIPSSFKTIVSSFKLSISMSLIGVITGEFLVSERGLGYLIIYGTQIFNLDLVLAGILILLIISYLLYKVIEFIERIVSK